MDQREVINKARQFKDLLAKHIAFDKIFLYGSYAQGSEREDSDIDIAVVVDDAGDDFFAINPLLWKLRRSVDDRIEPILIEKKHDPAGFLDMIRQTGIEI